MADLDKKDRELIRELYRLLDKRSRLYRGGAKKVLGMDPTGCVQPLRCVSALGTRVGAATAVNSRVHDLGHCSRAVQKLFEQSAAPPIAIQYPGRSTACTTLKHALKSYEQTALVSCPWNCITNPMSLVKIPARRRDRSPYALCFG